MRKHRNPIPDTLLHLSGGQDSTFVLWDWLRKNPDRTILVHHVNFYHPAENRLHEEKRAVRKILRWLKNEGLDNFIFQESEFAYGTLPYISVKDIQIVSVFTAMILRTSSFTSIDTLLLSWHKGEVDSQEINRGFRVKKVLEGFEIDSSKIRFEFPIMDMTRQDMYDEMPLELFNMIHTCRKPLHGNPCGRCKTCLEMNEIRL